jgi:hypothetical protein
MTEAQGYFIIAALFWIMSILSKETNGKWSYIAFIFFSMGAFLFGYRI